MADAYFYNEKGRKIEIFCTSLSGVEVTSMTIDEAVNYDLFAVRGKTLSLTFVTSNVQLYYNSLKGQGITIKEDNETIFEGVISSIPEHQPFSYKVERYTLYADDTLTAKKYTTYDKDRQTIYSFLLSCLPDYVFTPCNSIDTTKAELALEALTDTTTTEHDVLQELCKLLNVEVSSNDKAIRSAILGTPVIVNDHYATTQLGVRDGIHSAKVSIVEETPTDTEGKAEEEGTVTTWGDMVKNLYEFYRNGASGNPDNITFPRFAGLYKGNTFDNLTGAIKNVNAINIELGQAEYYRLGFTEGVTYMQDRAFEMQIATDIQDEVYQFVHTPTGTPNWRQTTLILPQHVVAIGAKTSAEQDLCFADVEENNVYFTRPYKVTVPSVTTFKPQTYLLINGHINIFPYWTFGHLVMKRTDSIVKYKSGLGIYPYVLLTIRLYNGSTLVKTLTDVEAKLDIHTEIYRDGEHVSPFSLDILDTTDWNTGTKETGFKVQLNYNEVKDVDRLEVDFKGVAGFVGTIYNTVYDPHPEEEQHTYRTVKYSCLEWRDELNGDIVRTDATQIICKQYTIDLDFTFASGYLEEETPTNIDTDSREDEGEAETWFYWQQNSGIEEVEYSNRLNSLITFPTKNTVKVEDGYLEKVTSTLYSGSHYTEELQLATIIDQRKDGSSVLRIDLLTRERLITFRGVKYRLVGCSFDVVRGVYECEYIEVKPTTQID